MSEKFTVREFRAACGQFATGVAIVTGTLASQKPVGVTVNSFSSVSLEPPLVLFCLDKKALSFDAFSLSSPFAVNFLTENQQALSNQFARQSDDKFVGVEYSLNSDGVPILAGCLTSLECRMHAIHDGGDHQIIVGEVSNIIAGKEDKPLLYFRGSYEGLA